MVSPAYEFSSLFLLEYLKLFKKKGV